MEMLKNYIAELTDYMGSNGLTVDPLPKVIIRNSPQEEELFATTGYYDPTQMCITLFIHGRHMKDILRSYAHELVHHHQNLKGQLAPDKMGEGTNDPKYAQNNQYLRAIEEEAFLKGNMLFRDWTDNKKYNR